ncbi:gamma-glutamyltransferase [Parashewanella spongiae]|nr:gamma-glutamyltransferase [Parashewanella spongiae]MCL1076815.1 gamma-glutamyltransferase [Parashewanella spongiae]
MTISTKFKKTASLLAAVFFLTAGQVAADSKVLAKPATQSAPPLLEYSSIVHPVIARNGMVASQEVLASQVGVDILKRGGNAVDAAVGVGFALAVTLPRAGNIAGGGFMLVYLADKDKFVALDYKEMAPAAASRNMYILPDGSVDKHSVRYTRKGFGVPGTVAAFAKALKEHGTMTLAEVLQPSINLARNGIKVTDDLAFSLVYAAKRLGKDPEAKRIFFREDGKPLQAGDTLYQKDLAWSLEQIAQKGPDAFYKGEIAQRIAADMKDGGGLVTQTDMASYVVADREPVRTSYRKHDLVIMPPPSSGGVHIAQMLNVFKQFDLKSMGHNTAATIHLMSESMRQAYADRSKHLGDPDFNNIPIKWLTSNEYAKQTVAQISMDKARSSKDVNPGTAPLPESPDTTHFSVMDKFGNVVSNTYSLNYSYGSGIVAKGTGILLNNVMDDFSAKPGSPNGYGLVGGEANAIAPKKRALSSMTPAIVMKDGKPFLVTGSPGGSRIITTVMQVILNVIDHDMNIAEATHAVRVHHQWLPDQILIEPGLNKDTIELLKAKGHKVVTSKNSMGSTQSIVYKGGYFYGSADPRRPGAAAIGF